MRVAYFVNIYPAVSHTFIRREIHALETLGVSVARFAIRTDSHLVDARDRAEAAKTRVIMKAGAATILRSLGRALIGQPAQFFAVLAQAVRMGFGAERGVLRHLAYVVEAAVLAAWCADDKVEHIHAHFGSNPAAIAMFASRLSGISYSFTAHGPFEFDTATQQSFDDKLRYAAFAVCVSSYGRAQLMRYVAPDRWAKIALVHCGLDDGYLRDEATPCPPARRFVCVGRLCAEKAQEVLVGAARRLRDEGETFEIVLAGDGPTRARIETAIAEARLQDFVKIIGWASGDRVKAEILAARAFVLPSFAENLPVVIMEAMALGRPVISTYIAGIPELVAPGVTGWLAPAADEEALAQAMREALAASTETLSEMGAAGRLRVQERHDVLIEAAKLKALFEGRKAAVVARASSAQLETPSPQPSPASGRGGR